MNVKPTSKYALGLLVGVSVFIMIWYSISSEKPIDIKDRAMKRSEGVPELVFLDSFAMLLKEGKFTAVGSDLPIEIPLGSTVVCRTGESAAIGTTNIKCEKLFVYFPGNKNK
jgi:hypothetical protein